MTEVSAEEMREACRRAAKNIRAEPERWIQRTMIDWADYASLVRGQLDPSEARGCAAGHVWFELGAGRSSDWNRDLNLAYRRLYGLESPSLQSWNDRPGRTPEQVADRLEDLADRGWPDD